jgi:DNA-binding MltR family transcriptional regulator
MSDEPETPNKLVQAKDLPLKETLNKFFRDLRATVQNTQAGHVLVGASIISEQLRKALLTKMRPLTEHAEEELFENFGPLSSLASRISVAFALNILPTGMRDDMLRIKAIRNKFAHSSGHLNFTDPVIVALCKKLSTYNAAQTDLLQTAYMESLKRIASHLDTFVRPETAPPTDQKDKDKEQG